VSTHPECEDSECRPPWSAAETSVFSAPCRWRTGCSQDGLLGRGRKHAARLSDLGGRRASGPRRRKGDQRCRKEEYSNSVPTPPGSRCKAAALVRPAII